MHHLLPHFSIRAYLVSAACVAGPVLSLGGNAQAQSTQAMQMVMGNPSGATAVVTNPNNYLMQKPYYALSYNKSHATPNWVSWRLDKFDTGTNGRTGNFAPDTSLPSGWYQVTDNDYVNSGYDRGHNCPSGDRTLDGTANQSTFYMDNIVPQEADNNQGPWADLENYCRTLAEDGNTLFIISVPNSYNRTTISSGKIYVPRFMSKIIVVLPAGNSNSPGNVNDTTRVIAVDMPNISGIRSNNWGTYRTSVDKLESYIGYDFLDQVNPSVQAIVEAKVDNGPTS